MGDVRNLQPGTSIAGSYYFLHFHIFSIVNTVSLMTSLFTILLVISGYPLKNRLTVWLLMTAMCTSVGSVALAYLYTMSMVTPYNDWISTNHFYDEVFYCLGISGVIMLIHTIWFFAWLQERRPNFFAQYKDLYPNY